MAELQKYGIGFHRLQELAHITGGILGNMRRAQQKDFNVTAKMIGRISRIATGKHNSLQGLCFVVEWIWELLLPQRNVAATCAVNGFWNRCGVFYRGALPYFDSIRIDSLLCGDKFWRLRRRHISIVAGAAGQQAVE